MNAQVPFEELAAAINRLETRERLWAAAIVPAQVGGGLFALEDGGEAEVAVSLWPIGGDVCAVTALRESDLERANRVAIFLRPEEGEAFESQMGRGLAPVLRFVIPSGGRHLPGTSEGC